MCSFIIDWVFENSEVIFLVGLFMWLFFDFYFFVFKC